MKILFFFILPFVLFTFLLGCEFPLVLELEKPFCLLLKEIHWSPDEKYLAATYDSTNICAFFNTQTGKIEHRIKLKDTIVGITWLSSQSICIGLKNGEMYTVNFSGKQPLLEKFAKKFPDNSIKIMAYSPAAKLLAVHSDCLGRVESGRTIDFISLFGSAVSLMIKESQGLRSLISCFKWSQSGKFFAVALAKSQEARYEIEKEEPRTYRAVYSDLPAELHIYEFPHLIKLPSGSLKPILDVPIAFSPQKKNNATSIIWSNDDRFVGVLNDEGTIEIYNLATKKKIVHLQYPECGTLVTELSLSSNNRYLVIGGRNKLIMYDLLTERIVDYHSPISAYSDPFGSLASTLNKLAKDRKNTILSLEAVDARRISCAPFSPLIALALKTHDSLLLFPHALVIFDIHNLYTSYRQRLLQSINGRIPRLPAPKANNVPKGAPHDDRPRDNSTGP